MSVRFFYVDESYDDQKFCLSALSIRYMDWKDSFKMVQAQRRQLRQNYGLYIRQEIHARDLIAGRGHLGSRVINKYDRVQIFRALLRLIASLPRIMLFNVCLDPDPFEDVQIKAWKRLLNRIDRTMLEADKGWMVSPIYRPRAMIFSDEGKENQITQAFRKVSVYNPTPSRYGGWAGSKTKNIPISRIVEEPIFKKSHQSFLIQLADCAAYALLKRETPLPSKTSNYGIPVFFEKYLAKSCYKKAATDDPLGIVRK
jgi:Protein of unknown function (DUF3800)